MLALLLGHSQQIVPVLAPASFIGFVLYLVLTKPIIAPMKNTIFFPSLWAFVYCLFISVVNQWDLLKVNPIGFIASDGKVVYSLLVILVLINFRFDIVDWERVVRSVSIVALGIGLFSIASLFLKPVISGVPVGAMFAESRTVLIGFLGTKNPFAGSMGQLSIVLLTYVFCSHFEKSRALATFALLVSLLCVALSGSRGYLLGVAAAALYVIYFSEYSKKSTFTARLVAAKVLSSVVILLGGVVFFLIFTESVMSAASGGDGNVLSRFALYGYAYDYFKGSVLVGVGPGTMTQLNVTLVEIVPHLVSYREGGTVFEGLYWDGTTPVGQHSHNVFLQVLVDFGVIGFIVIYGLLYKVYQLSKEIGGDEGVVIRTLYLALVVYYSVSGLVAGYTFFSPSTAICFYVLIGYIANNRGRVCVN